MTQNRVDDESSGFWSKYAVIIFTVAILVVITLSPVKRWLNSIPYLWIILYPLLSIFSLYLFIKSIQSNDEAIVIIKWGLLVISAILMTLAVLGVGSVLFTVGKILAVLFIILELGTYLYAIIR
jgi:hypothetical protein